MPRRLADEYSPDSPAHQAMMSVERRLQHRPSHGKPRDTAEDDWAENVAVMRSGWLTILSRGDWKAFSCFAGARGRLGIPTRLLPFRGRCAVDPTTRHGVEWGARLRRLSAPTAALVIVLGDEAQHATGQLVDPETQAPVFPHSSGALLTTVPWRLPTAEPLAELLVGQVMWVRTADGTLYLAPDQPCLWPSDALEEVATRLASLADRLLNDITTDFADARPRQPPPPGLTRLLTTAWPDGTSLSRTALESARATPAYPDT